MKSNTNSEHQSPGFSALGESIGAFVGGPVAGHTPWLAVYCRPCGEWRTWEYRLEEGTGKVPFKVLIEIHTQGQSPETLALLKQICEEHNNAPALLRERDQLRTALENTLEALHIATAGRADTAWVRHVKGQANAALASTQPQTEANVPDCDICAHRDRMEQEDKQ